MPLFRISRAEQTIADRQLPEPVDPNLAAMWRKFVVSGKLAMDLDPYTGRMMIDLLARLEKDVGWKRLRTRRKTLVEALARIGR